MAIAKGIKQFLKTVKSKEVKDRNKNTLKNEQFMKTVTSKEAKKRNKKGVIGEKIKNVSPALAGSLGIGVGASQKPSRVQEMKSGGVVSSKSKSSGVALKGFGKEIK